MLCVLIAAPSLRAQGNGQYFTVNGIVKNKEDKKKLKYVVVSVPGSSISTITNTDGEFTLKIADSIPAQQIEFSLVGFNNLTVPFHRENVKSETYFLEPEGKLLDEIMLLGWQSPEVLVREAVKKIPANHSDVPNLMTGFYRETVQKGRNYINIAEAIINVYKTAYKAEYLNVNRDRVQVFKGRKLLSAKPNDTLSVKLLGGPNLSLLADAAKNPDLLLDPETLHYFKYKMDKAVFIDGKLHYVVEFEPQVELPLALYRGKLYIEMNTLAFSRAEFSLDMKDRNKVTEMILKKKPAGMRFTPEELSFVITYKQRAGKTYLNYIRNEIRFKCDWKKRLFATNYTVVSEMVMTDNQLQPAGHIPAKDAFREHYSLSDKVSDFYDADFWGAYNIIEPTESLENAVNKLKKGYK